jgi:hypothetical protein
MRSSMPVSMPSRNRIGDPQDVENDIGNDPRENGLEDVPYDNGLEDDVRASEKVEKAPYVQVRYLDNRSITRSPSRRK